MMEIVARIRCRRTPHPLLTILAARGFEVADVMREVFEDLARNLAAMADRILRKHGKNIIGKQFAPGRLANVMIDLFVLACVLSRVSASIDRHGTEKAAREIDVARVFTRQVNSRVSHNLRQIDDNDDEAIKSLAEHAYERGGYTWDVI